ncbi:MAG: phosphoglycerate kinase [Bacillota bacterium]|nr:phosphoglycerate kinase [Bacillota bacterium]
MRTIKDADISGKRVLIRVDFNVPMSEEGKITDDNRIQAALPTIQYVLQNGGKLILMSHMGRPKGKRSEKYSLLPIANHLSTILGREVKMAEDCIGPGVEKMVDQLNQGDILMLENVRFYPEEEKNDAAFARALASIGEIYVNDAFGTAHRAHASTAGVADYLPSYAGFLLENEVNMLRQVMELPQSPRMAILGGAKVKDKLGLIRNLLDKMDVLLLGGSMACTFLKAKGFNIGKSLCEDELMDEARKLMELAEEKGKKILLPSDAVVVSEFKADAAFEQVSVQQILDDQMIVDIGSSTVERFGKAIAEACTIIWNGPLGVYEFKNFARGTNEVAHAVARSNAVSVIGGGDTAAAFHTLGIEKEVTHISTGGGATLEFLEGMELPGVKSCEV